VNKISIFSIVVAVHLLSQVQLFVIPWTAACQAFLSFSVSQNFLKLMSVESMTLSNHLILCHSLHSCPLSFPVSGSSIFCPWVLYRFSLFHFLFFSEFAEISLNVSSSGDFKNIPFTILLFVSFSLLVVFQLNIICLLITL